MKRIQQPAILFLYYALSVAIAIAQSSEIIIGPAQLLYRQPPDLNNQYCTAKPSSVVLDGVPIPMKRDNTSVSIFLFQFNGMDKYHGPASNPFQYRDWGHYYVPSNPWQKANVDTYPLVKQWLNEPTPIQSSFQDTTTTILPYIESIYKVTENMNIPGVTVGDMLGFVHVEQTQTPDFVWGQSSNFYQDCTYKIALAYSKDGGSTWRYCGDIVVTEDARDRRWVDDNGVGPGYPLHNNGGCPFIVIGGYFYVYWDEFVNGPSPFEQFDPYHKVCVARAPVSTVLQKAAEGTVSPWKKYYDGAWDEPGMGGRGTHIINTVLPGMNPTFTFFSVHNNATKCQPIGKYILPVMTSSCPVIPGACPNLVNRLLLYSSIDGIHWQDPILVEEDIAGITINPYACFFSLDTDASDDFRTVGQRFYIMYPRYTTGYNYELYKREITANANAIANSSFEHGLASWSGGGCVTLGIVQAGCNSPSAAKISILGSNCNAQFYQHGFVIERGKRYRVKFQAWSSRGEDMQLTVLPHNASTPNIGLDRRVDLGTTPCTNYQFEFVATGSSTDARLRFYFNYMSTTGYWYAFDNVSIEQILPKQGDSEITIPTSYALEQNFPNPFNPTTNISFSIPNDGNVSLKVFDLLGREVASLVNEARVAGSYTEAFDASKLSSGTYFYRLESGSFVQTKKMAIVK